MGEIAEDMVEGVCCELCGVYFTEAHGYPVVCASCFEEMSPSEKKRHQLATEPEL